MKILVISCSEKKDGNTEKLTKAFSEGAESEGAHVDIVRMSKTDIRGCRGCNSCTTSNICIIKDGMQEVYPLFLDADVIVFATPVYFWGISSQMKAVMDRLYALGAPSDKGYFAYPVKRCALIASAADIERHFWVFESVQHYWYRFTTYLRWPRIGELFVGACGGTKGPRRIEKTNGEERAAALGREIASLSD